MSCPVAQGLKGLHCCCHGASINGACDDISGISGANSSCGQSSCKRQRGDARCRNAFDALQGGSAQIGKPPGKPVTSTSSFTSGCSQRVDDLLQKLQWQKRQKIQWERIQFIENLQWERIQLRGIQWEKIEMGQPLSQTSALSQSDATQCRWWPPWPQPQPPPPHSHSVSGSELQLTVWQAVTCATC